MAYSSPLTKINSSTAYPQTIHHGPGSVSQLLAKSLPSDASKAFIITGTSLATKTPLIRQVESVLGERHAGTFSSIRAHAPVADVDAAAKLILDDPSIDSIISVGGGSPIDSAKVIVDRVFRQRYPDAKPSDVDANPTTGPRLIRHIAIPTTLAAAECSGRAGFTTPDGTKTGLGGPWLRPSVIIYDSTFLSPHTPIELILSTGLRALDHAVELFYHDSPNISDETREKCLGAAAHLFEYLTQYKAACTGSSSTDYIVTNLQLASYDSLGYVPDAFSGPLGPSHSLGYALGSKFSIPHGVTSCITLAPVVALKYKTDERARHQIDKMYETTKHKHPAEETVQHTSSAITSPPLAVAIDQLVRELELESNLTTWKVPAEKASEIASRAAPQKPEAGKTGSSLTYEHVLELVKSLY